MKDIILKYLHVNLPIPKITLGKQNSWSLDLSHKFKKIKESYNYISSYFSKEEQLPHITKIGKVNQVELDAMTKSKITSITRDFNNYNYYRDFSNNNYFYDFNNSTVTENIFNNIQSVIVLKEPYIKFLTYLFNEFNLFS